MTPWEIEASELINCNCSYGCPCQFNALPTHGFCEALGGFIIKSGYYGSVRLDGLKVGMALKWPGPIHEGKGHCQLIIDSSASDDQRVALVKILSGQDTDPGATIFAVFATTYEKVFDPIFAHIELDLDVEARQGKIRAGNVLDIVGQPIRNPVTGAEHRARIDLPNGFEYEIAEIGSGTSHSAGNVVVRLKNTYAQFAHIHLNNHGVVRHRSAA